MGSDEGLVVIGAPQSSVLLPHPAIETTTIA
jgi:hypothetical protein